MQILIFSWILTLLVEFLVMWIFLRKEPWKLLLYSLLINSLTLPLATYSYLYLFPNLPITEIGVILIETVLLKLLLGISLRRAFTISIVANLVTMTLGVFIYYF